MQKGLEINLFCRRELGDNMIIYSKSKSGSQGCEITSPPMQLEKWTKYKNVVCELLRNNGNAYAENILTTFQFELKEGTNVFKDNFFVLHLTAPLEIYGEFIKLKNNPHAIDAFKVIISTFAEIDMNVRFIAAELVSDSVELVLQPEPLITTETVERALKDSQQLIYSSGAASAVDRIHTVLHGYLKAICTKSGIINSEQASLTEIFKEFRLKHPSFTNKSISSEELKKLFGSLATIIDTINTLRNRSSLAHPNDKILEEAEAILVINCARTILHYIDAKIRFLK